MRIEALALLGDAKKSILHDFTSVIRKNLINVPGVLFILYNIDVRLFIFAQSLP